ncbi:predicted protein [Chaetoceros tenuissimus]|uniref:Uncharacterized protein n=1 Tax=Chaetoceros tenuissimus TaxID=426638 RepID=A0AAD3CDU8_9STRA|nr:predicted protein [Chaetoceros tenuissimus]
MIEAILKWLLYYCALPCAVVAFLQYISSKPRGTNTDAANQMNSEAECFQEKITLDISKVKQLKGQHKKSNSQPSLEQIASVNTFSSESEAQEDTSNARDAFENENDSDEEDYDCDSVDDDDEWRLRLLNDYYENDTDFLRPAAAEEESIGSLEPKESINGIKGSLNDDENDGNGVWRDFTSPEVAASVQVMAM